MSLNANPAATDKMPKIPSTSATRTDGNANVNAARLPTVTTTTRNKVVKTESGSDGPDVRRSGAPRVPRAG